jgi:hypothetical protein
VLLLPQEINISKVILTDATIRCFFRFLWRIIGQVLSGRINVYP